MSCKRLQPAVKVCLEVRYSGVQGDMLDCKAVGFEELHAREVNTVPVITYSLRTTHCFVLDITGEIPGIQWNRINPSFLHDMVEM